jgi:hypothetical protein
MFVRGGWLAYVSESMLTSPFNCRRPSISILSQSQKKNHQSFHFTSAGFAKVRKLSPPLPYQAGGDTNEGCESLVPLIFSLADAI